MLLLAALLLGGCADARGTPDPTPTGGPDETTSATGTLSPSASATLTPTSPGPLPAPSTNGSAGPTLRLTDCTNFGGVFPVPMASARAALPEGFEPVQTPSDPAGGATLYVLGLRCAGSSVDGDDTGAATLAYAELAVVAPAAERLAGLADGTVPLVFAATPQAVGDALAALRLGQAGFGEVAWSGTAGAGDVVVTATLGESAFTLRGGHAPGAGGALGSGDFALYAVQDGKLVGKVLGSAAAGAAVDAIATLESTGIGLLGEARPVVRGFSVSGFSLALQAA
jgi:hypothetical protein